MRLRALVALLLAVPAPVVGATSFADPTETRAELKAVCHQLTAGDNHYFGRAIVADLEARLETPVSDPQVGVLLRGRLAHELVRLGRNEAAIEKLQEALELLTKTVGQTGKPTNLGLETAMLRLLATAHLQLAEDQNCVALHTAASCILPVDTKAVHTRREHGRQAGDLYLRVLQAEPADAQARWLLNLSRMLTGDYPEKVPEVFRLPPGALSAEAHFPHWRDIASTLGVNAFDLAGGAVMDDFDGDGLLDLVSSTWDPCEPMKAFRNDGHGGFEDVSSAWGLDSQLGGLNLVQADYDNDGLLDLLVLRGAWLGEDGRIRNSLLRNDLERPAGRFVDVTAAAGLAYPAYPTQAASWADFDSDGDLDLYVGNEATAVAVDPLQLFGQTGNSYPSQLFRNNGDGTFTDVGRAAGVANQRYAKAAAWGDYDNDGDPDLYVSNIGPNRLYRNNGDGSFTDLAPELGLTEPVRGSFPTWFFDYDNDGDLDLFVAAYWAPVATVSASYLGLGASSGHSIIYRNEDGRFMEVSEELGLSRPLLPMGANYGDLDNDGWLDIYLGTGVPNYDALMPNVMYRNDGGQRFQDITFAGGFGHLQKGHGVAFGDLDNDGDQDLFQQLGGAYPYDAYWNVLYPNPSEGTTWVVLRLLGREANRYGVGARIEVRVQQGETQRSIHLVAGSGGSFGGSSLQQEIGLGTAEEIESISITWPGSGLRQVFRGPEPNRFYQAIEGQSELWPLELPRIELTPSRHRPGGGR